MNVFVERNQRNRAFWADQNREVDRLQADPCILRRALRVIASEASRGVPSYSHIDFGVALREADADRRSVLEDQGRHGGRARRRNPLQELIIEIVSRSPEITERELLSRLRDEERGPVVQDIDGGEIWFIGGDRSLKSAPLSGLKDRLSRAKKFCGSR